MEEDEKDGKHVADDSAALEDGKEGAVARGGGGESEEGEADW